MGKMQTFTGLLAGSAVRFKSLNIQQEICGLEIWRTGEHESHSPQI